MTPTEVQRALRLITARELRQTHHFPITVLAQMAGLSRETVYQARNGKGLTRRVVQALGPLLTEILAGRMTAQRNRWQVNVREDGKSERNFSGWPSVDPVGSPRR